MVTENTVDSDIYAMQERKATMNAAILNEEDGSGSGRPASKAAEKKEDARAINSMLQSAMDRYLKSPIK